MTAILWVCILFVSAFSTKQDDEVNSLYKELDEAIAVSKKYEKVRDAKIENLKIQVSLIESHNFELRYKLNQKLFQEYKAYVYDSAVSYLTKNMELAAKYGREREKNETKMQLSYLLTSAGMYREAIEILDGIPRKLINGDLLVDYYLAYDHVYGEMGNYTLYKPVSHLYYKKSDAYRDSLTPLMNTSSEEYYNVRENILRAKSEFTEALKVNDLRFKGVAKNTPAYSVVAFYRAINYKGLNNIRLEKYWLAQSAISDIKSAVKDHASLWMLAELLYSEGQIERAHQYINFSWKETQSYRSRLRNFQTSEILFTIGNTYQQMSEEANRKLRLFLVIISVMGGLLAITTLFVYRQMKVISKSKNFLRLANEQLQKLNKELNNTNFALNESNRKLNDSNKLKEEYIGRYLEACSFYIEKLENFRKLVNKKVKHNQIGELLKVTESFELQEKEFEELHANFDKTFLHIFPNFIDEFNSLLLDEQQILIHKEDGLNTELRIFALIRLGVEDSSKIAEFLNYSPNTIYNYRAKVKNRAKVPREEFEDMVKRIC